MACLSLGADSGVVEAATSGVVSREEPSTAVQHHSSAVEAALTATVGAAFDTCSLLRLRVAASSAEDGAGTFVEGDALGILVGQLRIARADYARLGMQPDGMADDARSSQLADAERAMVIFRRVWKVLRELPAAHPLNIPPIDEAEAMLGDLLLQLTLAVRGRERSIRRHDTGHLILRGVKGTAKTTLLKAIATGVAVCSSKYFLAYVDYGELRSPISPAELVAELYTRVCKHNWVPPFGRLRAADPATNSAARLLHALDAAIRDRTPIDAANPGVVFSMEALLGLLAIPAGPFGCCVGLIADGIEEVVQPCADAASPSVALMRDLESFARHTVGALLVLSGSSADLRARLLAMGREAPYTLDPSFNRSLFAYHDLGAPCIEEAPTV